MFEQATRIKLRFATNRGLVSTEDLWDLPLQGGSDGFNLDEIAKGLYRDSKEDTKSFVVKKNKKNALVELKLDIVKSIIKYKLNQADANEKAEENKAKRAKIMGIIAEKQDENLKEMDVDDLKEMLNKL